MDLKPEPNRKIYIEILKKMTPEQRLMKSFELTEMSKNLFLQGLKKRFPDKTEKEIKEIKEIYLEKIANCHNQNY